jgi:hypothetical protein
MCARFMLNSPENLVFRAVFPETTSGKNSCIAASTYIMVLIYGESHRDKRQYGEPRRAFFESFRGV